MPPKARKYDVGGRMLTVREIADELGLSIDGARERVWTRTGADIMRMHRLPKEDDPNDPTWDDVAEFIEMHPRGATLQCVAAAFGLSIERIRQIETDALRKLRPLLLEATR